MRINLNKKERKSIKEYLAQELEVPPYKDTLLDYMMMHGSVGISTTLDKTPRVGFCPTHSRVIVYESSTMEDAILLCLVEYLNPKKDIRTLIPMIESGFFSKENKTIPGIEDIFKNPLVKDNPYDSIFNNVCCHLQHNPPSNLYISGDYTHTCPGCGEVTVVQTLKITSTSEGDFICYSNVGK